MGGGQRPVAYVTDAEEIPHPRAVFDLEGAEAQEQAFLDCMARGRLHHAWLLTGPEGIGKATFAYRAARRLLGAKAAPTYGLLGADPEDPVSRQIVAQSCADLLVLGRPVVDGKVKRDIPVDLARKAPEFFSKAPASAPYRVAIVDAADDMNANAANALLKTLEEPPERGVLFLISHSPGRLLPTLRSRCRRLAFRSWSETDVARFVSRQAGVDGQEAAQLAAMSGGAPGAAWRLAVSEALELDDIATRLVAARKHPDTRELQGLVDRFRGAPGLERFGLFFTRLAERLRQDAVGQGSASAAALWPRLIRLPDEVEGLNLDRADAFWSAVAELRALPAS